MNEKWDKWFLGLAQYVATASKDPSTQVGAVIVRPDKTIAGIGYNGFPRGIADTAERLNDRPVKYELIVHAELNAIHNAREPLYGYTLYTWPVLPCSSCALHVIQKGITRVVSMVTPPEKAHWALSCEKAKELFDEAKVEVTAYENNLR